MPLLLPRAEAQALQTYNNKDVGLAMLYPASFSHESSASRSGEFGVFALPAKASANCTTVLAVFGDGLDRIAEPHQKGKPDQHDLPKGTLTLSEIKRDCVDKDALDDTILSGLAGANLKGEGIHTLARVSNSAIGNITVWWAAGAGYGKGANGKRNANSGTTIFGTAAAVVNGHILVWSVSANDPASFNRLMGVSACFNAPACEAGFSRLNNLQLNVPGQTTVASR